MYTLLLIILLLLPIPLYLWYKRLFFRKDSRKVQRFLKETYEKIINKNELQIADFEIYSQRIIALDRQKNKLLLLFYEQGLIKERQVRIEDIRGCQVKKRKCEETRNTQRVSMQVVTTEEPEGVEFIFFDENLDDLRRLPLRIKRSNYWRRVLAGK